MTKAEHFGEDHEAEFLARYEELRRMAHALIRGEANGCTVEATALVNQAYERVFLADAGTPDFTDVPHMLRTLATAMRRILVDRARRRNAQKRGGHARQSDLDLTAMAAQEMDAATLLDLNDALARLVVVDPESARLVELHWFAGLTIMQVAGEFGCSRSRADKIWLFARRWLARALKEGRTGE